MTRLLLPSNFALQSMLLGQPQSVEVEAGRGRALLLQPEQPGAVVQLRLEGLLPHRFYRLRPGDRSFARTDRSGVLHTLLQLDGATLITVEPVI